MGRHCDDIDELIGEFSFLDNWEDRYTHIIELGKALPPMAGTEKTPETRVKGCASQVWLVAQRSDTSPPVLTFYGDSDAHIVKGLIAVVFRIFSGYTPGQILQADAKAILKKLGLSEHLSPQRANGLQAMIERIRTIARDA